MIRAQELSPPSLEMLKHLGSRNHIVWGYIGGITDRDRKTGLVANFDLGVLAEDTPFPYRLMLDNTKYRVLSMTLCRNTMTSAFCANTQ